MVFVRFSLKAFYVALIAFGLSFLYGFVMFAFFADIDVSEDLQAELLSGSWVFMIGFLLHFVEVWWRKKDPNATIVVWGISIKYYGWLIAALGLYLMGSFLFNYGYDRNWLNLILFTAISTAILSGLLIWRNGRKS